MEALDTSEEQNSDKLGDGESHVRKLAKVDLWGGCEVDSKTM